MDNISKYRELCSKERTIPIFSRDWWLDAVCDEGSWDVVLVERNGEIIASLPYYAVMKPWGRSIVMPQLTQTMGIWIKYPEGQKYANKLGFEKEAMTQSIENLPETVYFSQNFHHSITNWLPFYWKGFKQTTRYTYLIDDLSDLESVFEGFKGNAKNKIRKAEKIVSVDHGKTVKDFYDLNKKTFERQRKKMPYSFEFVEKIDKALAEKGCRKIFFAVDGEGKSHSALYLIWDETTAYVHMVGEDPFLRSSGAGILLVWEAMKFAGKELGLNNFDFEGSMIEPVEEVRRSFGAKQIPYFNVYRDNRSLLIKILVEVKRKLQKGA